MFSFDVKNYDNSQQSNIKFIDEEPIIRDFLCKLISPSKNLFQNGVEAAIPDELPCTSHSSSL